jgi:hypothetical protein
MAKHTPGPWTLIGGKNGEWDIEAVGDHDTSGGGAWAIAQTFGSVGYGEGNIESDANARLIAAAPELLTALQTAKDTIRVWHGPNAWDIYDRCSPEMMAINAAISKATGAA